MKNISLFPENELKELKNCYKKISKKNNREFLKDVEFIKDTLTYVEPYFENTDFDYGSYYMEAADTLKSEVKARTKNRYSNEVYLYWAMHYLGEYLDYINSDIIKDVPLEINKIDRVFLRKEEDIINHINNKLVESLPVKTKKDFLNEIKNNVDLPIISKRLGALHLIVTGDILMVKTSKYTHDSIVFDYVKDYVINDKYLYLHLKSYRGEVIWEFNILKGYGDSIQKLNDEDNKKFDKLYNKVFKGETKWTKQLRKQEEW